MVRTLRPSGIQSLGEIPWGSHICQFYRSVPELLDILVPWFKAGLEHNEYCIWLTSRTLSCNEAEEALRAVCPDFDARLACGQILIASGEQWYRNGGRFDGKRVLDTWLGKLPGAMALGYDGVRVSGDASWLQQDEWRDFVAFELHADNYVNAGKVLAMCTYPIENCGAHETLDAMRSHAFAMIRRDGAWEVVENQARRRALEVAREFRRKYQALTGNMIEGFAYHQLICNDRGEPSDYLFVEANEAFGRMIGLPHDALAGRRASELFPGDSSAPELLHRYASVALTGQPARFEQFMPSIGKWFAVSAYSPERGYFAVTMEEITETRASNQPA